MASWEPARLGVSSVTISFGWTDPGGSRNCNPAGWAGKPGLSHFCPGSDMTSLLGSVFSGYFTVVVSPFDVYAGPRGCQEGFSVGGSPSTWKVLHKSGATRLGFGRLGPYGYDLLGQVGMAMPQEEPQDGVGACPASR